MGNKEIPKIPAPKEIEDWKTILIVKQITKLKYIKNDSRYATTRFPSLP